MASSTSIETAPSSSSQTTAPERRGIPGAQFVEDVQTYLSQLGLDVNSALAFLQERSLSQLGSLQNQIFMINNVTFSIKVHCFTVFADFSNTSWLR